MAFKLRSGNTTTFKKMGASPNKDMKTGSYEHSFESPAKQRKSDLPKSFNVEGSKWLPKTPGFDETKLAKKIKTENFRREGAKTKTVRSTQVDPKGKVTVKTNKGSKVVKALKNTPKQLAKGGKQILKKGSKFLRGPLGVLGMMGAGTLSASAGNVGEKSEGEQIKALLKKHKLKGGDAR